MSKVDDSNLTDLNEKDKKDDQDNIEKSIEHETDMITQDKITQDKNNTQNTEDQNQEQDIEESFNIEESELNSYDPAEIEEKERIDFDSAVAIIESILFASDRPVSFHTLEQLFKDTCIDKESIKQAIERLKENYSGTQRGVMLEYVSGGFQLRTKVEYAKYLRKLVKGRVFRLSGPALEVLSIVAYKAPIIKHQIDEIRGVESGHLLRALMEKGLVKFSGKSDLPGRPMQYITTNKFLEIFGLRNLNELPSMEEIDAILPEGIGQEEEDKKSLGDISTEMKKSSFNTYSQNQDELGKITDQLSKIITTSEFFEEEKSKIRQKQEEEKAKNLQEAMMLGEDISEKDKRWLSKYLERQHSQELSNNQNQIQPEEHSQNEDSQEKTSQHTISQDNTLQGKES